MSRLQSLKGICEGYILAGCYTTYNRVPETSAILSLAIDCFVCQDTCKGADCISLSAHKRLDKKIMCVCIGHSSCLEPVLNYAPDRGCENIYRGLSIICHNWAAAGIISYLGDATDTRTHICASFLCFVCRDVLKADDCKIVTAERHLCCAAHAKCLDPFVQERDRVLSTHARESARKAWCLPLGDCRVIIAEYLQLLLPPADVFGAMFAQ
jgi:hypothetical protein